MRKKLQLFISSAELLSKTNNVSGVDLVVVFQEASGRLNLKSPKLQKSYLEQVKFLSEGAQFSGKFGELVLLRRQSHNTRHTLYIGGGTSTDLSLEKFRRLGAVIFNKLKQEKISDFYIDSAYFDVFSGKKSGKIKISSDELLYSLLEGIFMTDYKFDYYQSVSKFGNSSKIKESTKDEKGKNFISGCYVLPSPRFKKEKIEKLFSDLQNSLESINLTRDWSNEPSNKGTPEFYATEAARIGKLAGLKVSILTEADAKKENMNLFLAVGNGSEREGRVVILEYTPSYKKNIKTVVFLGKGVTFDSGGISIKPSMRMEEMKHDMTGAATVMGAVLLAAKQKSKNKVVGILALTENMPSGSALQPGNIIQSRNGKTVEIINTDAEGRLILADLLDYSYQFEPSVLIDIATLTGAVNVALGKQACAIFSQSEKDCQKMQDIGAYYFERMWKLPLYEEYFDDLKTEHADMKNAANDPAGGTIRAALFLKQFIRAEIPWIHIDIASTATNMGHLPYFPKRGSSGGFVRTLARFACEY